MFMFVAIITGIIIHKRIFKDIFTFRARSNPRGWMDAHILPAVATLPFLIMITYSGLLLFQKTMMPWAQNAIYGKDFRAYMQDRELLSASSQNKQDKKQTNQRGSRDNKQQNKNNTKTSSSNTIKEFNKNTYRHIQNNALKTIGNSNTKTTHRIIMANKQRLQNEYKRKIENQAPSISKERLKLLLAKADKIWPNNIGSFTLTKDMQNNTINVQIKPKEQNSIYSFKRDKEYITYDAKTLKVLERKTVPASSSGILNTQTAFYSLHMAHFADSTLRFILFLFGLSGIIIAGTGLVLWIQKRKKENTEQKSFGFYLVEKLNLGTIAGIFIALGVYFIANRFIPLDIPNRNTLEINAFFIAWLLSFIYAFIRDTHKAWIEQVSLIAILFISLPIINALMVFDNFTQIYTRDNIFIYFDLFFIFVSLVFMLIRKILIKKSKKREVK